MKCLYSVLPNIAIVISRFAPKITTFYQIILDNLVKFYHRANKCSSGKTFYRQAFVDYSYKFEP